MLLIIWYIFAGRCQLSYVNRSNPSSASISGLAVAQMSCYFDLINGNFCGDMWCVASKHKGPIFYVP